MSKKNNYLQQELGLDKKTSEAIKLIMDEGLLEPLLMELRNTQEAEEFQDSAKPDGIISVEMLVSLGCIFDSTGCLIRANPSLYIVMVA